MKFDELDLLMMMNADDINYGNLSEEMLESLALGDELYIANYALAELSRRESKKAIPVAWQILSMSHGDSYLQAAALKILFHLNREQATDYINKQVQYCDFYILNSIMELMIENEFDFKSSSVSVVQIILKRLKEFSKEAKFLDSEVRDSFLKLYRDVENIQAANAIAQR